MRNYLLCLTLVVALIQGSWARAHGTTASELHARDSWAALAFTSGKTNLRAAGIRVAWEDVPDGMARGKSWRGTPFQIADKVYSHGLAFNASKTLLIQLGSPAKRFIADVGLENNDDTRRGETLGHGSVTFQVVAGDKELFTSTVLRRTNSAVHLDLPLNGASEFEIRVKDAGDGRGWDQALWAEAEVLLENNLQVRLQDLPIAGDREANPFPFSLLIDGTNASAFLRNCQYDVRLSSDSAGTQGKCSWMDETTGLLVAVDYVLFKDFPAVEWVVQFTNAGSAKSPVLENIQAFSGPLPCPVSGDAILHWAKGGVASFDDFAPQTTAMKPGTKFRLQPGGGRSSSQVLPFFNLQGPTGGVITAIGWTGEWAAGFSSDSRGLVYLDAGLDRTRIALMPGESIRTPRMLLLFYEGDRWAGQNRLRQFILQHHRPLVSGTPMVAPITCGNWGGTRAEIHLDNIQQIIRQQLPIAYYWIDAEWYGEGSWPVNVGNWNLKKDLYPNGFKPLSDCLRASRRELMLWFEPERVFKNTPWYKNHPGFLFNPGGDNALLNLGKPEVRQFVTDFISLKVEEFGLGCYRQDFNIDPLSFWRAGEAPDRQGYNEIKYIEGLYAFWDGLLQRHPGLIIDNCASGGRRLDLETLGRATPFWRTDGPRDPIAHQCHTYGLLAWIPLSATSQDRAGDDYEFRSSMCSSLCLNWWVSGDAPAERIPPGFPFAWAKKTLDLYLHYRDFYYGDYYPLTAYSQSTDVWMSYQLDRPDKKAGVVVVLRRPGSPYSAARFPLRGLSSQASYSVKDLDSGVQLSFSGKDLADAGLPVSIEKRPGSALLMYTQQ